MEKGRAEPKIEARFWRKLADGKIECLVCPKHCRVQEGRAGACQMREREGERFWLSEYGRVSGFCIDPIEKKPLYHFYPGSAALSFGTIGCNLACRFCQNWDLSHVRRAEALCEYAEPEEIASAARESESQSVAFTYNDPIVFFEFAEEVAKACHRHDVKTVAVTAGYMCEEPRAEFFHYIDAANVDLKSFSEKFYREMCGAHLQPVLDTLSYIKKNTKTWLEITTLLIPGENDSEEEVEKLTSWIATNLGPDVPLHFSAFHPAYHLMNRPPTPPHVLKGARQIAMENGLRYVYTGNVRDQEGSITYCAGCHRPVIVRENYSIADYALDQNGACKFCGSSCPGVFSSRAGSWGDKRVPIVMG